MRLHILGIFHFVFLFDLYLTRKVPLTTVPFPRRPGQDICSNIRKDTPLKTHTSTCCVINNGYNLQHISDMVVGSRVSCFLFLRFWLVSTLTFKCFVPALLLYCFGMFFTELCFGPLGNVMCCTCFWILFPDLMHGGPTQYQPWN